MNPDVWRGLSDSARTYVASIEKAIETGSVREAVVAGLSSISGLVTREIQSALAAERGRLDTVQQESDKWRRGMDQRQTELDERWNEMSSRIDKLEQLSPDGQTVLQKDLKNWHDEQASLDREKDMWKHDQIGLDGQIRISSDGHEQTVVMDDSYGKLDEFQHKWDGLTGFLTDHDSSAQIGHDQASMAAHQSQYRLDDRARVNHFNEWNDASSKLERAQEIDKLLRLERSESDSGGSPEERKVQQREVEQPAPKHTVEKEYGY